MSPETLWNRLNKRFAGSLAGRRIGSKLLHRADRLLAAISGGRITLSQLLGGVDPIWLTTTGAKSGEPRTVPLIGLQDGDRVIIMASNWGQKNYPAWYYNLCANPIAQVKIAGITRSYKAYQAENKEYDRYWMRVVAYYPGYANYKISASNREIPIFVLEPVG